MRFKRCTVCRQLKTEDEFSRSSSSKSGLKTRCKSCQGQARKPNTPAYLEQRRAARYGLTVAELQQMVVDQRGKCKICRTAGELVVDHDHLTGKVRGLLCSNCNCALGMVNDNIKVLQRMIQYLQ